MPTLEPPVTLTAAHASDFEALVALRITAMRPSLERVGRFDALRARERFRAGFNPQYTRHILFHGERAGFVVVKPQDTRHLLLDHFYLHPAFQGQGIGTAALRMIMAEADTLGLALRVGALRDSDANRFYLRHGFRLVEEDEFDSYYVRRSGHVTLRPVAATDEAAFIASSLRSVRLHHPWVSTPTTATQFCAYAENFSTPTDMGFVVVMAGTGELAGVLNVSSIMRGRFKSAYLGYYAFEGFQGQGLMRAGVRLLVRRAFGAMKLHRLEANIQPGNRASIGLAKSCGFVLEGYSPNYLKIRGRWRDHERWAILAHD